MPCDLFCLRCLVELLADSEVVCLRCLASLFLFAFAVEQLCGFAVWVRCLASLFGLCVTRRSRIERINRHTLVWIGGPDEDVTSDFLSYFGRATVIEGDIFVGLDDEQADLDTKQVLAEKRGIFLTRDHLQSTPWHELLSIGARKRYNTALDIYKSGDKTGMGGAFLVDVSQSEDRLRCGAWLPTFARSTSTASLSKDRMLTPAEVDLAMGWPVHMQRFPAAWNVAAALGTEVSFSGLSATQRRNLAGNGMMLPACMAWWVYILSKCVRRALLQPLRPPLQDGILHTCDSSSDSEREDV